MPRRDPSRPVRYVKAWTSYASDPAFYTLTFAEAGVFFRLLLWHANASDVPGLLLLNDEPMTIDDVTIGLYCRSIIERRLVAETIKKLVRLGFMEYGELAPGTRKRGWSFPRWNIEQAEYNRETAEQSKSRVQRWRAQQREKNLRGADVIPLRQRERGAP